MNRWLTALFVMIGSAPYVLGGIGCPTCVPLPEPASLLLLVTGVGAIGLWRARRSKSQKS
jgi:hypothetical protein